MDGNSSAPHVPMASTNEESFGVNVVEGHNSILHAETYETLNEVAAAVNASLHQLEHLRDNITELTNDSLLYGSRLPTLDLNLGPPHAAIVLSDATTDMIDDPPPVPEIPRRRPNIPTDVMERLLEYEASIRPRMIVGMDTSSNPPTRLSSQQPSTDSLPALAAPAQSNFISRAAPTTRPPPYPDLIIPPQHNWLESSLPRHPGTNSDDASTVLGRRVAARAATGGTHSTGRAASQLEQIFLSRTVEIARELHGMTNFLRSRGTELLERSQARMGIIESSRSVNSNPDANSSGIGRVVGIEGRVSAQLPPVRPSRLRRFRTGQATNETELELEPGVPEHTLSYPSVRSIASSLDVQLNRVLPVNGVDGADSRTYLIRRRLNADGEEEVHNIRLSDLVGDEMDRPMRSISRGQPETRRPSAVLRNIPPPLPPMGTYTGPRLSRVNPPHTSTNQSRSFESTTLAPRIRRLDWEDLEETDEEDEWESRLARSRVRPLAQVRSSNSSAATTLSGATMGDTLSSMTRASLSHTWDDNGAMARVRINPLRQVDTPAFADVFASAHSNAQSSRSSRSYRSSEPEPLPMALADMMPTPIFHTPNSTIINVHKYANLAGR